MLPSASHPIWSVAMVAMFAGAAAGAYVMRGTGIALTFLLLAIVFGALTFRFVKGRPLYERKK